MLRNAVCCRTPWDLNLDPAMRVGSGAMPMQEVKALSAKRERAAQYAAGKKDSLSDAAAKVRQG